MGVLFQMMFDHAEIAIDEWRRDSGLWKFWKLNSRVLVGFYLPLLSPRRRDSLDVGPG